MSCNHVSSFFIIALIFLLAAGSPVSTGQTIGISVDGRLCCTATGNCLSNSVGIPGQVATLNCTVRDGVIRTAVVLGQNITDANGRFNITVAGANASGVAFNQLTIRCVVTSPLPINNTDCNSTLLRLSGFLVSLVKPRSLTSTVPTLAFGRVRNATTLSFVRFASVPQLF